ncbi:MAG: hypothetical protein ACK4GE_01235, partial [Caldimicrobium sp.]
MYKTKKKTYSLQKMKIKGFIYKFLILFLLFFLFNSFSHLHAETKKSYTKKTYTKKNDQEVSSHKKVSKRKL